MRSLFIAIVICSLSACGFVGFPGVYKIDVEQGNIVTQELADQLKPGMSRRQVRFILGTPLVEDTFNQDRWDYRYVKRNGPDVIDQYRLTVLFAEDSLQTVSGDYLPPAWSTAGSDAENATDESTEESIQEDAEAFMQEDADLAADEKTEELLENADGTIEISN